MIKKWISRCILGFAATMLCSITVVIPAKADICFLPTGICEQGSVTRKTIVKECSDYIDNINYFLEDHTDETNNIHCDETNLNGCSLYYCTRGTCEILGFKLTDREKKAYYPDDTYDCKSCTQGNSLWWSCEPKACASGKTQAASNCQEGESWVAVASYGKSGNQSCGDCVLNTCGEGLYLTPPIGCYTCSPEKKLDSSRTCYKCYSMKIEYMTQAEKEAKYEDDGCFTFETTPAADGTVCYRAEEVMCGSDQYKSRDLISGKYMCKCHNYTYRFSVSQTEVVLPANGVSKTINVDSWQDGNTSLFWEYYAPTSKAQLQIEKLNGGKQLKLTGPVNKSHDTDLTYSFNIVQTQADEATKRSITINVRVEHDTCPANAPQFSDQCATAGWKSKNEGTSVTGEKCYKCYDDNCKEGFTRGAVPNDGYNYDPYTTPYGSACHKAKPDNCPDSQYSKIEKNASCPSDGNYDVKWTEFGRKCCKPLSDNCNDSTYTKYPRGSSCPSDGNYSSHDTPFGSKCCKPLPDDCPHPQQKTCECGGTEGSSTQFGTQCYYCSECCNVGSGGAYGQPGQWGSACTSDDDCQASSDYPLICVKKNANGCGVCRECETLSDCKDVARRKAKSLKWFYIESSSGCDKYIGNYCMKKDPNQSSACTGSKYPAVDHESGQPYHFYGCIEPEDGSDAAECTDGGECLYSVAPPVGPGWVDDICYTDADCKESSDFPLYCFYGKCLECDKYSTCEALADDDTRFKAKYGNINELTCAKKINGEYVRYAGETWTLEEYKEGYRARYFCTAHGECSQCKGDGLCRTTDGRPYTCEGTSSSNNYCPCYSAKMNDDGTWTKLSTKMGWCS